jgi:hypothetical protein
MTAEGTVGAPTCFFKNVIFFKINKLNPAAGTPFLYATYFFTRSQPVLPSSYIKFTTLCLAQLVSELFSSCFHFAHPPSSHYNLRNAKINDRKS